MGTVFRNATLVQFDPPMVASGDLREAGGRIDAAGSDVSSQPGDEVVACEGAVLMPGLVNGHTHLYAALACGMPAPPQMPRNFHEILRYVWWRLDRAHDLESVEFSAMVGALAAVQCGTTTLIDHHASPNAIESSLDSLQKGMATVGCRGVLCYETTDRNGSDEAQRGLEENERYLQQCLRSGPRQFAGMVGAHASFTLREESLARCVNLARRWGVGVHIHIAEDGVDERITRKNCGCGLFERFAQHGLLDLPGTVLAHGIHLSAQEIGGINERRDRLTVVHNPNSNMNNGVGYAPAVQFARLMLGTDGIGGDLWREARAAVFKSHDAGLALPSPRLLPLLAESARCASGCLGVRLGRLEPGAAADLLVTGYVPATELTAENLVGHLIYGMGAEFVRHVMVDGRWVLRDGHILSCDPAEVRRRAVPVARRLHERMATLPCD